MGGSRGSSPGRTVAFALVVAGHAGLLLILMLALDARTRPRALAAPVGTLILLSLPVAPDRRLRRNVSETAPIERLALPPIPPPPDIQLPDDTHTSIDWLAEARRAAGIATAAPRTRPFGEMPKAPSWLGPSRSSPTHRAGEQYRLETGESVVWLSDRCYIVSEPPPLGMPDVLARSLGTRTVCQAPPGPREGELFKDLPAYKKYHSQ
jgi:hypothetical protein